MCPLYSISTAKGGPIMAKVTIYDVADAADVSKSTVSRVINNQGNISKEKRERVLKAIEELNYKPNIFARGLTNVSLDAIMILTNHSAETTADSPFFSEAIYSISTVAADEDFDVILQTSENNQDKIDKCLLKVNDKLIRGIIVLSSPTDQDFFKELDSMNIPIVLLGNLKKVYRNIFSVDTDNYQNSYDQTQFLIEQGHKKIACLHPPLDYNVSVDRLNGYKDCLKANGIPLLDDFILNSGYTLESAYDSVKQFLQNNKGSLPTAIFATDDSKVLSVYKVANELGISIPSQLSVTGYTDNILSNILTPSLTGIEVPYKELGAVGAQLLFDRIKNEKQVPNKTIIPTELMKRESVASV